MRFYHKICSYTNNIRYNSVNDIIPVGNVGKLVTGSSGTPGTGCGSGTIGGYSSLGIVGAEITRDKIVIRNDQFKHEVFI
jgi:hypothetical protein